MRAAEEIYGLPAQELCFTPSMESETTQLTAHYASREWRFGANIPATFCCEETFPWGTVTLEFQVMRGMIVHASVFTDAMEWELSSLLQHTFEGLEFSRSALQKSLSSIEIQSGIREDLSRMLEKQEI